MDQMKVLVTRLKDRIPNCCYCDRSMYEERAYVAFECMHVVCFECTEQEIGVVCPKCLKGDMLDIDYKRLEVTRSLLADSLKSLTDTDFALFPTVFTSFYDLISVMTPIHEESKLEVWPEEKLPGLPPQRPEEWEPSHPNQPIPNQIPASQPSVRQQASKPAPGLRHEDFPALPLIQVTTCECGNTYPSSQTCPCAFLPSDTCSECHVTPCICSDTLSRNQLWNCWNCGYEYNYVGSGECGKCGRVIRGNDHSRARRRPRRANRRR